VRDSMSEHVCVSVCKCVFERLNVCACVNCCRMCESESTRDECLCV